MSKKRDSEAASLEQIQTSTYIKNVHKKLRLDASKNGWEETWNKHLENTEVLTKYAASMENLSCKHWTDNEKKENAKAQSRIEWINKQCELYFTSGIVKNREQEYEIAKKCEWEPFTERNLTILEKKPLLDVGSCYNPFKAFDVYDVIAIDIAPSNSSVQKCDFLNITIGDEEVKLQGDEISVFKKESFHIVVFSLLLDYLPSPELREKCCKNAYDLLKYEGILMIITPDAKHVSANAKYMKSWRWVLANAGFRRTVYEKLPYIHCMVFRKCPNPEVAKRWATLHNNNEFDKMYVPQDFNSQRKKK